MRTIINLAACALLATGLQTPLRAQECELPVAIVVDGYPESMPEAAKSVLENQLSRIATSSGLETDFQFCRFILTARIDVLDKSVLPGPPMQTVYNLGVTFYMADVNTRTKFASAYMEVNGVGTNETKSLIDAFRRLNAGHPRVAALLEEGKRKIMDYYDANYKDILTEADRCAAMQQYDKAIALAVSIPPCSRGGEEAQRKGLAIYGKYRDKYNQALLARANAVWAAGQGQAEAAEAGRILSAIDPEAACYGAALDLAKEIKAQVRKDLDFEMRDKHADAVELEKLRITAVHDIGVAYGRGQQPRTTNLTWLR